MIKRKLTLLLALLIIPLMVMSNAASAHCKKHYRHYHYGCHYSCQWTKNGALAQRVVYRLRSNMTTYDQPIRVTAVGHKVMLSGSTGTMSQRQMALEIARYTCGVCLVMDNLHLQAP